ncbi:ribbon-helix-helix domain-containing protein [Clostridium estertheticum]|uniref:Ribbon-helix-helix domain-containing protein n=1 Tax=Clostridium estertheticum TaxID=238834 RepID=A0AA47I4T4_9CLOT|nr:ribbon-helix-helix domain-containing protein [Clostridium estertheticum]MBU3156335.1 ribbon-helix-helix domain-containing protein [Clostridium estertheticum]WAG59602.1 ribbon-helix-helix domain-containing protein [Clostridium estertheticum]
MLYKKPGRPTDSVKDSLLKVRVDIDTLQALDDIAKKTQKNRSELIREILPIISSKDYENMISTSSLQRLEQYSVACNDYFENPNLKINVKDVSSNFPAFVDTIAPSPILYIKYPTYKIRILITSYNSTTNILEPLFKNIDGMSTIYLTQCFQFQTNQSQPKITFFPELMCLKSNLEENTTLKNVICSILMQNNIQYEVWPAYSIVGKNVTILNEDNQSYIINT